VDESSQNKPVGNVQRIFKITVPVIVVLAETKLWMHEIVQISSGSVIEFEKNSDDPLRLLVNNRVVAEGEAVKVGENFGLRLTRVGSQREIIQNLGPESTS